MDNLKIRKALLIGVFGFIFYQASAYARNSDEVTLTTLKLADHVYMIQGQGGNMGVCAGDDGVFLIDDQFAPLTEKIRAEVAKISDQEIRFVINTHWHHDHVGGNENLGKAGATIVSHENVRHRMSMPQVMKFFNRAIPAAPEKALPIITFAEGLRFYLNGQEIEIRHLENAHTDGDSIVFFKTANVIHTGDIYFSGIYPFIDLSANGGVDGMIDAGRKILAMINLNTKIIPGHGPLSTFVDFENYIKMLEVLRDRVKQSLAEGKTLKEIQRLNPSAEFDAKWGKGFLSPDQFIQILTEDLSDS